MEFVDSAEVDLLAAKNPLKRPRSPQASKPPDGAVQTWRARANFVRDDVPFGCVGACTTEAGGRQGFEVGAGIMEEKELLLQPIPPGARLETHGVELLDVRAALEAAGVTERNVDLTSKEQRIAVGGVLLDAAEARFPGKESVHQGDTSRVSGGSVYGEVTVRDTSAASKLRAAHHAFHVDHFLAGVAQFWGHAGARAGAEDLVSTYWHIWKEDFGRRGVSRDEVVQCVEEAKPGLVNLWVSLTPGEIEREPLAVADGRSLRLGSEDMAKVSTVPVTFPALKDTLTLMRACSVPGTRWLFRPRMRFGEALLFSTVSSPHSAVSLTDSESSKARQSAEIRIFMVNKH